MLEYNAGILNAPKKSSPCTSNGFIGFNATCGLQLDPQNEWIMIAGKLPWRAWETLYAAMFPAETGNIAKPCRMVMRLLIIQQHIGFTDRDLVAQLQQNP